MRGMVSLNFISALLMLRQFLTGSTRLRMLYEAIVPVSIDACETNITDVDGSSAFSLLVFFFFLN